MQTPTPTSTSSPTPRPRTILLLLCVSDRGRCAPRHEVEGRASALASKRGGSANAVSYTHLRAHETSAHL
eukprot:14338601-Alexandrium_andersonii.AAC.1